MLLLDARHERLNLLGVQVLHPRGDRLPAFTPHEAAVSSMVSERLYSEGWPLVLPPVT